MSEFNLFVTERKLGSFDTTLRASPAIYSLSSRVLYVISHGRPHCLRVIAAAALLTAEALKVINGLNLTVLTSHNVSGILNAKVNTWMTDSWLLKYQSLLLEGPITKLKNLWKLKSCHFPS